MDQRRKSLDQRRKSLSNSSNSVVGRNFEEMRSSGGRRSSISNLGERRSSTSNIIGERKSSFSNLSNQSSTLSPPPPVQVEINHFFKILFLAIPFLSTFVSSIPITTTHSPQLNISSSRESSMRIFGAVSTRQQAALSEALGRKCSRAPAEERSHRRGSQDEFPWSTPPARRRTTAPTTASTGRSRRVWRRRDHLISSPSIWCEAALQEPQRSIQGSPQ